MDLVSLALLGIMLENRQVAVDEKPGPYLLVTETGQVVRVICRGETAARIEKECAVNLRPELRRRYG